MVLRASPSHSSPRPITPSTIEWVTRMRLTRGSGGDPTSFSRVCSLHPTKPWGGAFFFGPLPTFLPAAAFAWAFALCLAFSTSCSGASAITSPSVSKPARPARPAIWWNSRALRRRIFSPSNLVSAVMTTVRIGTLMPTPSVSVPQMTRSRPRWASCSTRRR